MTDTLREIEKGREAKYKLDEELRFKVECRRNKLVGLWAAEHMGMAGPQAQGYAKSLVREHLMAPGIDHIVKVVARDFSALGVKQSERDVIAMVERLHEIATEQVAADFPTALDTDHTQIGG